MDEVLLDRLRSDLQAVGFGVDPVRACLGESADDARQRGVFAPARRVVAKARPGNALATLIALFLLGDTVAAPDLDAALPSLRATGAESLGLVSGEAHGYRASLSLNPVTLPDPLAGTPAAASHWWILSDLDDQLRRGPARPDHVMGVGGATRSLIAQLPLRQGEDPGRIPSALDLGTGCGIIALFLARAGVKRIVATDISERALRLANANARLNGYGGEIEFRRGDLFDPVSGERFALIASNPPFVITPRANDATAARYEYRDGGMTGDLLAEQVVREGPRFLEPGGTLVCLANWESPWGTNGLSRVRAWIDAAAVDAGHLGAWVIERDRVSPELYAETWARDGGARPGGSEFEQLIRDWLDDFAFRRITSIGLGSIRVKRLGDSRHAGIDLGQRSSVRLEHAPEPFAGDALGNAIEEVFLDGLAIDRMSDSDVLGRRWYRSESVNEVRVHAPGTEGPREISLTVDRPLHRTVAADPLLAAAVGACDGELTLRQIADALATILEIDPEASAGALLEGTRELVWLGMITSSTQ